MSSHVPHTYRHYQPTDGSTELTWPAAIADSVVFDGKLFLGGSFTSFPTTTTNASRIVGFDGTNMLNVGSLQQVTTNPPNILHGTLTRSEDTLYANVQANLLQRWDKDTNAWVAIHNHAATSATLFGLQYHAGSDSLFYGQRAAAGGALLLRQHDIVDTAITISDAPAWFAGSFNVLRNISLFNNGDLLLAVLTPDDVLNIGRFTVETNTFELLLEYDASEFDSTGAILTADIANDRIFLPGGKEYLIDSDTIVTVDEGAAANTNAVNATTLSDGTAVVLWSVTGTATANGSYLTIGDTTLGPFESDQTNKWRGFGVIDDVIYWERYEFVPVQGTTFPFDVELYPQSLLATRDHVRVFIDGEEIDTWSLVRDDDTHDHTLVLDEPFDGGSLLAFRETRADRPMIDFTPAAKLPHRHIDLYYRQLLFILQELCNMSPIADALGWPLSYGGLPLPFGEWTAMYDSADNGATEFDLPDDVHFGLIPHFMDIEVELASTTIDPTIPGTLLTRVAEDPGEGEYVLDIENRRILVDEDQNYGTEDKPIRIARQTKVDDLFFRLKDWGGLSSTEINGLVLQIRLLREETCGLPLMPDEHPLNNPIFPRALNFLQFVGPGKTFRFPWQGWIDPNVRIFIDDIEIFDYTIDWERFSLDLPFELDDGQTATMHGGARGVFPTVPTGIRTDQDDDGPMWGPKPDIKGLVCAEDDECMEEELPSAIQQCIDKLVDDGEGPAEGEQLTDEMFAKCEHSAKQTLVEGGCRTPCGSGLCIEYSQPRLEEFLGLFGIGENVEPTDLPNGANGSIRIGQTGTHDYLQTNSSLTVPNMSGWSGLDIPMTPKQFGLSDGSTVHYITIPNELAPSCAGDAAIPGPGEIWIARQTFDTNGNLTSSCVAPDPDEFFLTWCQAPPSGCAGFIPSNHNSIITDAGFHAPPCDPFLRYLWTAAQGNQLDQFKEGPAIQQFISDVQGMSITQIQNYLKNGDAPQV